jgi:hypothetical protein
MESLGGMQPHSDHRDFQKNLSTVGDSMAISILGSASMMSGLIRRMDIYCQDWSAAWKWIGMIDTKYRYGLAEIVYALEFYLKYQMMDGY